MIKYIDPEDEDTSRVRTRKDNADRVRRQRERNAALSGEEAYQAAREAALRLLDRRSYASGKLRQKLVERGFNAEAVAAVIERLNEVGILDDRAYAEALVRTRFQERGLVGRALRQELRKQGIAEDLAAQVCQASVYTAASFGFTHAVDPDAEEIQRGIALARKKYLSAPPERAYARTSALLVRRGYRPGQIAQIITQIREEAGAAGDAATDLDSAYWN